MLGVRSTGKSAVIRKNLGAALLPLWRQLKGIDVEPGIAVR